MKPECGAKRNFKAMAEAWSILRAGFMAAAVACGVILGASIGFRLAGRWVPSGRFNPELPAMPAKE